MKNWIITRPTTGHRSSTTDQWAGGLLIGGQSVVGGFVKHLKKLMYFQGMCKTIDSF